MQREFIAAQRAMQALVDRMGSLAAMLRGAA